MTAWEILVANSTAPAVSIAWVHLNSQSGAGAGLGGRSDLSLSASNEVLLIQDKADKKGLTV